MANANERAFAHTTEAGFFITEEAHNNIERATAALQLLIDAGNAGAILEPEAVSAVITYIHHDLREVTDDARFCPGELGLEPERPNIDGRTR